jgi:hypothetical protein
MAEPIATTILVLALFLSGIIASLPLFRRGSIRMTQPTVIFFGLDFGHRNDSTLPKVYFRALLFSMSKRGHVIESMYVALLRKVSRSLG